MGIDFQADLKARGAEWRERGLWRELRRLESGVGARVEEGGRAFWNFSSNDYLGLAGHPLVREGAIRAVERFGGGSGASRLLGGTLGVHAELEEALAVFKGTEAALTFGSGYAAAVGTIGALLGREDVMVVDRLVHASVVDAARGCGARLRVFAHNDLGMLEDVLRRERGRGGEVSGGRRRVLVVTESVFSMDGDLAPLASMVELKDRYGAWLMVDEAHGTGVLGARRGGLVEHLGLAGRVEVQMATLGKALGAAGGVICGSRALIEFLINRARSFVFSTAPVPAAAGAALAAVGLVQGPEGAERGRRLWANVDRLGDRLRERWAGLGRPLSPIVPVVLGAEAEAMRVAEALRDRGFLAPGIRYPTVARGRARLRLTVSAAHEWGGIDALVQALGEVGVKAGGGDS